MQRNAVTDVDAAAICGLKVSTLRKWRRSKNRGPRWHRYGRAIRYLLCELEEWQRAQPTGGGEIQR
jgi:hypothetical protein